jgi:acyl dehydratase
MPLNSSIVGAAGDWLASEIDARWTMAYAAALGDTMRCYFDTLDPRGIVAHPMFPVCFEWPVIVAMRSMFDRTGLSDDEARRGVHASHDLVIHRHIRPPERLRSRALVAAVEQRKPGAFQLTRLETVDEYGAPVCTTWYGSIYRGVAVQGGDRSAAGPPDPPAQPVEGEPLLEIPIPIAAGLAHVYTECARIFNPIHTDAAVAHRAGLPAIILHGTAALALAASRIIATSGGDPTRVRRIGGKFRAMVMMPSEIVLRILARDPADDGLRIHFEVLNDAGAAAIRSGLVILDDGDSR